MIEKALPKKETGNEVKRTPSQGASKKVSGAGGKPRYTYPAEKAKPAKKKPASGAQQKTTKVVVMPIPPGPLPVDHKKFAKQLGVPAETVQRIAARFRDNPKLRGPEGFADFMHANLREFNAKHALDKHYYHRLYAHLHPR